MQQALKDDSWLIRLVSKPATKTLPALVLVLFCFQTLNQDQAENTLARLSADFERVKRNEEKMSNCVKIGLVYFRLNSAAMSYISILRSKYSANSLNNSTKKSLI